MPKGNSVIPNVHFHKDWQSRVKVNFNQPMKKKKRALQRSRKAAAIFPRPLHRLRSVVVPPTIRYNMKTRLGRGFTLEEIKAAGLTKAYAQTIGIAVDHRRRNKSDKSLKINVQRLKEYQSKLVLFPRNNKKVKAGEASKEEQQKVTQHLHTVLPIKKAAPKQQTIKLSDLDRTTSVHTALKVARTDAKKIGIRAKRQKEKEEKAALELAKKQKK